MAKAKKTEPDFVAWARLDDEDEIVQFAPIDSALEIRGRWEGLVWARDSSDYLAAMQGRLDAFADVVVMMEEHIARVAETGLGYRIGNVRREQREIRKAIRKLEKI